MTIRDRVSRRKPPDSRIERQIITGMIINDRFLREMQGIYRDDALQTKFAQAIAGWCLDYFAHHKTAPNKYIQDIFTDNAKQMDPDQVKIIQEFLVGISAEHIEQDGSFNVDYILDKAEKHFRLSSLQALRADLSKDLIVGDADQAEARVGGFIRVARPKSKGIDVIHDTQAIIRAFEAEEQDRLIMLPGELGWALGPFERGALTGIVAASGIGKTWWLMLIAIRALLKGYNVLFISMEMSEQQMLRRIYQWFAGFVNPSHAGKILIPIFDCEKNQKGICGLAARKGNVTLSEDKIPQYHRAPAGYIACDACRGQRDYQFASWFKESKRDAWSAAKAIKARNALLRSGIIRGSKFKFREYPSRTLTMDMVRTLMHNLEYYENFIPDMLITDYADKFKVIGDYRQGINAVWEDHKGIAQEKYISAVTASQSNTSRTGKKIKQGDWAEDIRKLNHIDQGMAVNQTPAEKRAGLFRNGILKRRHDDFDLLSEIIVTQSLKIGRPYLDSYKLY